MQQAIESPSTAGAKASPGNQPNLTRRAAMFAGLAAVPAMAIAAPAIPMAASLDPALTAWNEYKAASIRYREYVGDEAEDDRLGEIVDQTSAILN